MADLFGLEASESDDATRVPTRPALVLTGSERVRGKHYVEPRGYAAPPGTGPDGMTCRQCRHYASVQGGARSFPKCTLNKARWTGGRGSDILVKAPACRLFEPKPDTATLPKRREG